MNCTNCFSDSSIVTTTDSGFVQMLEEKNTREYEPSCMSSLCTRNIYVPVILSIDHTVRKFCNLISTFQMGLLKPPYNSCLFLLCRANFSLEASVIPIQPQKRRGRRYIWQTAWPPGMAGVPSVRKVFMLKHCIKSE